MREMKIQDQTPTIGTFLTITVSNSFAGVSAGLIRTDTAPLVFDYLSLTSSQLKEYLKTIFIRFSDQIRSRIEQDK